MLEFVGKTDLIVEVLCVCVCVSLHARMHIHSSACGGQWSVLGILFTIKLIN